MKTLSVLLFAFLFASCQTQLGDSKDIYDILIAAPDADVFLKQQIKTKKVIFISESHDIVDPILFLSVNLEDFHKAGVRYLFLEGKLPLSPENNDYYFSMFYPWQQAAWKYEWQILSQSVKKLNQKLSEQDKLKVIFTEEGLPDPKSSDPEVMADYINRRDLYAANRIIEIMDSSDKSEKAIIFYGGSHGSIRTYDDYSRSHTTTFDWKPLGVYLLDYYGKEFASSRSIFIAEWLEERDAFTDKEWEELKGINKILFPDQTKDSKYYPDRISRYDYVLVSPEPTYGIFYQYIPSDENLKFILQRVRLLDTWLKTQTTPKSFKSQVSHEQYHIGIYYLKLYFGNLFEFSLWDHEASLVDALNKVEEAAFSSGKNPSEYICFTVKSMETLHQYHRLMRQSGIDYFQQSMPPDLLSHFISSMEQAVKIFPEDLWSQYWLNMGLTKAGQYERALVEWQKFFENPLSLCMDTLPVAYNMAAQCAFELEMVATGERYSAMSFQ